MRPAAPCTSYQNHFTNLDSHNKSIPVFLVGCHYSHFEVDLVSEYWVASDDTGQRLHLCVGAVQGCHICASLICGQGLLHTIVHG